LPPEETELTVKNHGGAASLSVRVTPDARRSEVIGFAVGVLQVKVAAAPVKGRANRELVACLGRALGVSPSTLTIIRGHTSRNKVIAVAGLSREEIIKRLSA
jgi:uncharacterized protein (TIGR00251 family)